MSRGRLASAFLLSPLTTPLLFIVTGGYRIGLAVFPIFLVLYSPFAYLAAAVFGIPLFLVFRRLGWENVIAYILGGAAIGLIAASVIFGLLIGWSVESLDFIRCAIAGALSASVFWLILYGLDSSENNNLPSDNEI